MPRSSRVRPRARRALTAMLLVTVARPLLAQDPLALPAVDPGAPPPGLSVSLQIGLPFSHFVESAPVDGASYGTLRGRQAIHLRGSYHLSGAVSGWLEGGASERGSRLEQAGNEDLDLSVKWWDLLGGANLALRCVGPVCPSVDVGAGVARRREAVVRRSGSRQIVGTSPFTLYEGSVVAALRLAARRWPHVSLVLRHQEGLTDVRPDLDETSIRTRSQLIALSLAFGRR